MRFYEARAGADAMFKQANVERAKKRGAGRFAVNDAAPGV